jgi:hypothetical protein
VDLQAAGEGEGAGGEGPVHLGPGERHRGPAGPLHRRTARVHQDT